MVMGRAFGGGMGRGDLCGALAGAYMVMGYKANGEADEKAARFKTYALVKDFTDRFRARHGAITCKDLLDGLDINTPDGRRQALDRKLFTTVCPRFVRSAGEIIAELS